MFFDKALIFSILDDHSFNTTTDLGGLYLVIHVVLHFQAKRDTFERHIGVFTYQDHTTVGAYFFEEETGRQYPTIHFLHIHECGTQATHARALVITRDKIIINHNNESPAIW